MGGKATSIDNELKTVTSEKGVVVSYDKLVIATGCTAFVQPITGLSNFERTWDLEQDVVKSDKSLISRAATSSKGNEYSKVWFLSFMKQGVWSSLNMSRLKLRHR